MGRVHLADSSPVTTGVVLGVVAALKVAGAVVPVLVEKGRLRGRRAWRTVGWIGACGVTVYGLLNVLVAWSVLGGLIHPAGGYDAAAMFGHAALWDPLFLLWGLLLAAGLALTSSPVSPKNPVRPRRRRP